MKTETLYDLGGMEAKVIKTDNEYIVYMYIDNEEYETHHKTEYDAFKEILSYCVYE